MNVISSSELSDEDKKARFQESFNKLTDLNINTLVSCIQSITTETGAVVEEPMLIQDFLNNTDRKTYEGVKELIETTVVANAMEPVELVCADCHEKYKVKVEFNQSSFFA
jgi:mannitol-1-phosphate/altronate dehydrogenase